MVHISISDREMRQVYCDTLRQLARDNPNIVALESDLTASSGMAAFQAQYPRRFINCGIQEANMIGVAAGLAAEGMVPYAHSFAAFAGRRVVDQVFLSCAYAGCGVKIVGSDPGFSAGANGGTHMSLEDVAIMRAIPGITIVDPTDEVVLAQVLRQSAADRGVYYIRLMRKTKCRIYDPAQKAAVGKAITAREGGDATLIAEGHTCVLQALQAADMLARRGIQARVLDMFTIAPLDREAVRGAARETGAIVTIENHGVVGGLGSAVAEVLAEEQLPVPFHRMGVVGRLGEVGTPDYLLRLFGLRSKDITRQTEALLAHGR